MAISRSSETEGVLPEPCAEPSSMNWELAGRPPAERRDLADGDEVMAVIAALNLWLEAEQRVEASYDTKESSWTRAARLESRGIAVGPATLRGGWRV
jgi:hypothetical protein